MMIFAEYRCHILRRTCRVRKIRLLYDKCKFSGGKTYVLLRLLQSFRSFSCKSQIFLLLLRCLIRQRIMATLTLQVESPSILEHLKGLLSVMKGVKVLREDNSVKTLRKSQCTELDKALMDVEKGDVKNFDTLEEMMNYLEA